MKFWDSVLRYDWDTLLPDPLGCLQVSQAPCLQGEERADVIAGECQVSLLPSEWDKQDISGGVLKCFF